MEKWDISLASSDAVMDQVEAIKRRCASGNVGTVPVAGTAALALDDKQDFRLNWLGYLSHWVRQDCD